jgi:hypothetical protein
LADAGLLKVLARYGTLIRVREIKGCSARQLGRDRSIFKRPSHL